MRVGAQPLLDRRHAQARKQAVLNVLLASPRPMTRYELRERLRGKLTSRDVESSVRCLMVAGLVKTVTPSIGGKTRATIRAVGAGSGSGCLGDGGTPVSPSERDDDASAASSPIHGRAPKMGRQSAGPCDQDNLTDCPVVSEERRTG